jgi:hypothetical protein
MFERYFPYPFILEQYFKHKDSFFLINKVEMNNMYYKCKHLARHA